MLLLPFVFLFFVYFKISIFFFVLQVWCTGVNLLPSVCKGVIENQFDKDENEDEDEYEDEYEDEDGTD